MAKYDHGGGCPCGLYEECLPGCRCHPDYIDPAIEENACAERYKFIRSRLCGNDPTEMKKFDELIDRKRKKHGICKTRN